MGRGAAFAAVLDEKLGAAQTPRTWQPASYGHRATVHTFYEFAAADKPVSGWRPRHPYVTPAACSAQPGPEAVRPRRQLSANERAALEQLNALGAAVGADFTADELRSAFRSLALTFHPDRHPRSSSSEAATLSRRFIALHDAYRALQTAALAA